MHDHDYHGSGYLWVWVIVIIIIIILIACAVFYFQNGQNGGGLLLPVRRRRVVVKDGDKVHFPPECVEACVRLSGDQEVPPVKTSGRGKGHVIVDSEEELVYYDIYVKKLSSDIDQDIGVHFHVGERGVNGPVVKNLNIEEGDRKHYRFKGTWRPTDATQPLTQQDLDDLLSGRIYVNVHTLNYPDGEVRGQVSC